VAADLKAAGVRHVIVGPAQHWEQTLAFFTDLFGRAPVVVEGVALWRNVDVVAVREIDAPPAH
jgi:hypothetical protein